MNADEIALVCLLLVAALAVGVERALCWLADRADLRETRERVRRRASGLASWERS